MKRFNFKSAIVAGFIATVVMTIFMALFDMNIMKILGMAMGKTGIMVYIYGGIIHLAIGLIYGLIYALIIQPIFSRLPGFLSGLIYGVIIFVIALIFTPAFMKTLHSWGGKKDAVKMSAAHYHTAYHTDSCQMQQYGQNQTDQYQQYGQDQMKQYDQYGRPVDPNQQQMDQYGQPVQPNQQQYDQYGRPVDPNQQQYDQYGRPVDPNQQQMDQYGQPVQPNQQQYDQYGRPVDPNQQQMDQYGRPVQPDQYGHQQPQDHQYNKQSHQGMTKRPGSYKKAGLPAWLWVLFNHLVYGFVLGIFYRSRKVDDKSQEQ